MEEHKEKKEKKKTFQTVQCPDKLSTVNKSGMEKRRNNCKPSKTWCPMKEFEMYLA